MIKYLDWETKIVWMQNVPECERVAVLDDEITKCKMSSL